MPRFYFDTHDGDIAIRDEVGVNLTALENVSSTTRDLLFDLGHAELMRGEERVFTAVVRNSTGDAVYQASMTLRFDTCHALGSK